SMKNDFLKIYPDAITRAENQYVERETEAAQADNIIQFPSKTEGSASEDGNVRTTLSREGYTLEKSVVLSRHNIRAPLSGEGSALSTITPHKWFDWSAEASQLSVRGGTLETEMGQYFRKWLEKEGLFEPNYRPEDGAVRIYANSKQRTIATAEFFAAGLLPVDGIDVEYHSDFDTMDPVFNPVFTYASDDYAADATDEIIEKFGPVIEDLSDNYSLLEDVIDVKESDDYKSGSFTGFDTGDDEFAIEEGKEPSVSGSLKKACQISDALVLQYFEEEDEKKAAFDHDLTTEQWEAISEIKDVYGDVLFTAPLVATNVAHPLLQEIESELTTDGRQFSFLCGHDSNLASVIAALDVSDYSLPDTIEKKTPIGAKLVINTWKDGSGEEYITLDLVYQKIEQLRSMSLLDDDNPPAIYTLHLEGLEAGENGMYKATDVLGRFKSAIEAYDLMIEEYQQEGAA
ncbi:MAG: histidine-type phosphatase, partial [Butyrivibrio sp.]|nr:histidine-type phosphatase [Butyrivibrio sp.]